MRVYDVFPFFNELDLLELRLMELDPVVDIFGLVELPVTFTGRKKALFFDQHKERFAPWMHKIRVHTPAAYPVGGHPMVDWFQRRQTAKLFSDAKPDDLIVLSDVDEIPSRSAIRSFVAIPPSHPWALQMALFYHRVDLMAPFTWNGTIVSPRSALGESPDMQELRDQRNTLPSIDNGGWHFSWLGTVEQIQDKLKAVDIVKEAEIYGGGFTKQPSDNPDFLEACRDNRAELLGRDFQKIEVDIVPGVNQPHHVIEWLAKHPHYAKAAVA